MFQYAVYFCLISGAVAQVIRDGACDWDNVPSLTNLNMTTLLGEWHQIQRIGNPAETGECSTITIELNTTSATPLTITNREVHEKHVHENKGYIAITNETTGRFRIQYENSSYDTVIMAADSTKYAVLYSCTPLPLVNNSAVLAWVYSRTTTLAQIDKAVVQALIALNQDLKNATWIEPKHTEEACSTSGQITNSLSSVAALLVVMVFGKSFIA